MSRRVEPGQARIKALPAVREGATISASMTDADGAPPHSAPAESTRALHRAQIARVYAELTHLCRSQELAAEQRRLWDDEEEHPEVVPLELGHFWVELMWVEQQFIGYPAQIARLGTLRQSTSLVLGELRAVRVFTEPSVAAWWEERAPRYANIARYVTLLDYLRLLAREHIELYLVEGG
jgi:hypothetical protein